jgi:hypothetical protein
VETCVGVGSDDGLITSCESIFLPVCPKKNPQ